MIDQTPAYLPVWFSEDPQNEDFPCGSAHAGQPMACRAAAWNEARRLCEKSNGIGFAVEETTMIVATREDA